MYSYSMIQWLFIFYLYSFLGWCFESAYVSIKSRKLTNRGFMRGPFLPLYGSGAVLMLVVSIPFQHNLVLVYIAGCVGATALEYVTGVTMEALFKVRYWDYSKNRFNFQGQICLGSTIAWGGFTLALTQVIHVPVDKLVYLIPAQVLTAVTLVLTVGIASDFALSFKAAIDLRDLLVKMDKAKGELQQIQGRLASIITAAGESLENRRDAFADSVEELKAGIEGMLERLRDMAHNRPNDYLESVKEELSELRTKYTVNVEMRSRFSLSSFKDFFQRDLLRGNPSMTSKRYHEELEELKRQIGRKKGGQDNA